MSNISCENCNAINVELIDVQSEIPTVFGSMMVEMTLCKTCNSAVEYCIYHMIETFEYLTERMSGRANQFNNKLKRTMK